MRIQVDITDDLQDYVAEHSLREPEALQALRAETSLRELRNMQVSPEQGQFLRLLIKALGAHRTLEVGVFTGYSLISCALGLPDDGEVVALEIDPEWAEVARAHAELVGVEHRIRFMVGDAQESLRQLLKEDGAAGSFDFAFIDADKENYEAYFEAALELLRPGGLIVADNVLWSGLVLDETVQDSETAALRDFARRRHHDDRVEVSMLPYADGLYFCVKR